MKTKPTQEDELIAMLIEKFDTGDMPLPKSFFNHHEGCEPYLTYVRDHKNFVVKQPPYMQTDTKKGYYDVGIKLGKLLAAIEVKNIADYNVGDFTETFGKYKMAKDRKGVGKYYIYLFEGGPISRKSEVYEMAKGEKNTFVAFNKLDVINIIEY